MPDRPPSEIARETFKLLAAKRLAPTPENYQIHYHEVAGTLIPAPFPSDQLRDLALGLPVHSPSQEKQLGVLSSAIGQRSWDKVGAAMVAYFQVGMACAAARASTRGGLDDAPSHSSITAVMEQMARVIDSALPALGVEDERFEQQANETIRTLRHGFDDLPIVRSQLANFAHRVSFAAEDQVGIRTAMSQLLGLVFQNIGVLCVEDGWLRGQMDAIASATSPPLSLRRLDDVESRLKEVISKQSAVRGRASKAQAEMQQLLATFVERLSQMSESSSVHCGTIERCARDIEQATTIEELGPVLLQAIAATRAIASETEHTRDELQLMRAKAKKAEQEMSQLHVELDRASAQARHDALTGALNRRGLDDALSREVANAVRKRAALCVALLDLDNFKKLNDQLGHEGGDAALVHLAEVARQTIRPQDSLARYGGEEFVIVLPDTTLDAGIAVLKRLQRELTTRYFLRGNDRVLITFSAGVAQLSEGEDTADALKRADVAMYSAKRTGKNRVLGS